MLNKINNLFAVTLAVFMALFFLIWNFNYYSKLNNNALSNTQCQITEKSKESTIRKENLEIKQ